MKKHPSVLATPPGYYYIKLCSDNFVIDLTRWSTSLTEYTNYYINEPLPQDVLNGYYKFNRETGLFEKDESKYQEYLKLKESQND